MTLIIAYVDSKKSYIASDTLGSNGFSSAIYKNKKIFRKDDMLIGGSGSYKQLQLLEKNFVAPARPADTMTSDEYMYGPFINTLIDFLKAHNQLRESECQLSNEFGDFIFVYDRNIYRLQSDLSFMEPIVNFETTGSGGNYAHAILTTLDQQKKTMPTKQKLEFAITATSDYIMSVGNEMELLVL